MVSPSSTPQRLDPLFDQMLFPIFVVTRSIVKKIQNTVQVFRRAKHRILIIPGTYQSAFNKAFHGQPWCKVVNPHRRVDNLY